MLRRKILTSAGLSILFMVVYGACSQITGLRSDVGVFFFEWERRIPVIPIFIIPYMSIDLFFVLAPFLCKTEDELAVFAKRISAGILIAGAFFLTMPMTLALPRPKVEGMLGAIFTFLQGFDQPYNLFPSLHIILRTILANVYARHTRGMTRVAVQTWFCLIGFSTVFTRQHHVSDIAAGFVVALWVFYMIPSRAEKAGMVWNRRIGYYYAVLTAACFLLARVWAPWGLLLLWPATSLLIVTAGYWGLGPSIFRKVEGRIPFSATIFLAPYFVGQQLCLRSYFSRCNRWDEVIPGLLIGRILTSREAEEAVAAGVTAVVDMTAEFTEAPPFRKLHYLNLQTLDLTAPTNDAVQKGVAFIAEQLQAGGCVYIHCKIGYSRTAVLAGAYLIHAGRASSVDDAIAILRAARPSIIVRPEAHEALLRFTHLTDCLVKHIV